MLFILFGKFQFSGRKLFYIRSPGFPPLQKPAFFVELYPIVCMEPLDGVLVHTQLPQFLFFCFFPFKPFIFSSGLVVCHKNTSDSPKIFQFRLPKACGKDMLENKKQQLIGGFSYTGIFLYSIFLAPKLLLVLLCPYFAVGRPHFYCNRVFRIALGRHPAALFYA